MKINYTLLLIVFAQTPGWLHYIEYFKHVNVPDESFFQTMLLNLDDKHLLSNIENLNLRFIVWEHPFLHPKILLSVDIESIANDQGLFAREFDEAIDSKILDLIDENILWKKDNLQITDEQNIQS